MAAGEIGGTLPNIAALMSLLRYIYSLPKNDSISDCIENLLVVDWKAILDILVTFKDLVDVVGEGIAFCVGNSVIDGFFHSKLKIF